MRWVLAIAVCASCGFHGGSAAPDAEPPPDVPPDSPPSSDWLTVVASTEQTCAIKVDHTLWCWGDNNAGEVGIASSTSEIAVPTQVGTATWTTVAAGGYHFCGIQTDGSTWCWGRNNEGELGIDETAGIIYNATVPAPVVG